MPTYNVVTLNVVEVIEADTPEEAIARSSYASASDPARAELVSPIVGIVDLSSVADIVDPAAVTASDPDAPAPEAASPSDG